MSSPTVANLFAKNEISASAITTQSCFLLSNNQELIRKINIPSGWNRIRLYYKAALYSTTGITSTNLPTTLFAAGLCSEHRSIGNTSNAHMIGVGIGCLNADYGTSTWMVNGDSSTPSGSLNTPHTNPPNSAWGYGPYCELTFVFITGSHTVGAANSGHTLPLYNAQWSSNYTTSNGYPVYNIAGFGWQSFSMEISKNSPLGGSSVTFNNVAESSFLSINGNYGNTGINIPRVVMRRSTLIDEGAAPFHDYDSWVTWWNDTTGNNSSLIRTVNPATFTVNETALGPLNCVNFLWQTGDPTIQMAIRDVMVVKVA